MSEINITAQGVKPKMKVHYSSLRLDWQTPKALYSELDKEFDFVFDPCPPNATFDGLSIPWAVGGTRSVIFMNPPYGREIPKWIKKSYDESKRGATVVCLIPSRTDTRWWHDYVMKSKDIRFIKGRLHFDEHKNAAPFPSAVVVFRGV